MSDIVEADPAARFLSNTIFVDFLASDRRQQETSDIIVPEQEGVEVDLIQLGLLTVMHGGFEEILRFLRDICLRSFVFWFFVEL